MLMLDISTSVGCETGLFHESSSHSPVPLGGCQRKRCGGACWVWGVELGAGLGQPGLAQGPAWHRDRPWNAHLGVRERSLCG